MTLEQERKLLVLCQKDLTYFEQFYDEYLQDVFRYVRSKVRETTQTEDITAKTFLQALKHIKTYTFQGKSIKCWLFTIARNLIYKTYQTPQLDSLEEKEEVHELPDTNNEDILDQLIEEDTIDKLLDLVETLRPAAAEIVHLKLWDDLSFEAIAEIVGKDLSAVKMQYYRALEFLRVKAL